jgi:hypothetical protein
MYIIYRIYTPQVVLILLFLAFVLLIKMIILRIIKAIRNTCIIIASPLIGPPLPVIGFQVLVITHISTKTVVPTIPIEYQVLPPCLIIGITQHV